MEAVAAEVPLGPLRNPVREQSVKFRPESKVPLAYLLDRFECWTEDSEIVPEEAVAAAVEAEVAAERQKAVETWVAESKPEENHVAFGLRICISTAVYPHPVEFLSIELFPPERKRLPR